MQRLTFTRRVFAGTVTGAALAALAGDAACDGSSLPGLRSEGGWLVTDSASGGFDPAILARLDRHIQADLPNFRSVVVVRHGAIVYERYYHGCTRYAKCAIASATKGVVSALVGIALRKGYLRSGDQRLAELFPEYGAEFADPRKGRITLRHLLTMTSGLDLDFPTTVGQMERAPNWTEFILRRPMAADPGERFEYGGASHLLTVILARQSKMSVRTLAYRTLFQPLGIEPGGWPSDPQGYAYGTHGLNLTTRDMARFGLLYLRKGRWQGKQLVPAAWVDETTTRHNAGGPPENTAYGSLWWVSDETGYPAYFAAGYGGQFIYVIPKLDLVVAMTGDAYLFPDRLQDHRHVVREFIVPACRAARPTPR